MTFENRLLPFLQCPTCGERLTFKPVPRPKLGGDEFGILNCSCTKYPLIYGIPIIGQTRVGFFEHTTGSLGSDGTTPEELVRLLISGRGDEALLRCLSPPLRPHWSRSLGGRLSKSWKLARWYGRREMVKILANRDAITAREVLQFYFSKEALGADLGDYFIHRFGQPRHLAALALTSNITGDEMPILDVACGAGHLDHYLTCRRHRTQVIGVDINFFQIWIAQHWIAPLARYVCCNVTDGLPFCSDSFSAVVVSDAYHYFPHRDQFINEIDRVAPEKTLIFTRVGNRDVMPNEGLELSLQNYIHELGRKNTQVFSEEELVRDYLDNRNPLCSHTGSEIRQLDHCKWLSFICNAPVVTSDTCVSEKSRHHSFDMVKFNPIYEQETVGEITKLKFRFSGLWYAYENHQMLA